MTLAPIVLFTYNRPWHTRQTVEALKKNYLASESELFIYSDGPKNEENVPKVGLVISFIRRSVLTICLVYNVYVMFRTIILIGNWNMKLKRGEYYGDS